MPQDPFVREKFTRERNAAKKLAAEYFEAVPDRDRELAPSAIAKYRVHREAAARADQRGVNVELTEIEIVILRGFADSTLNPLSTSREASRTTT